MILKLDKAWGNFDDFLSAVKSKYRVKFNKVLKKASVLEFKEFTNGEVEKYNDQMYAMYESTANRATFSLFHLTE